MPEKEFTKRLDLSGFDRIRVKLKTQKGKLIDIVFQYETFINGEWYPIVRYDCSHGFFHRDRLSPGGKKEKTVIAIDNLKTAAEYAEQDIKDRWEWYKEKYIKNFKNK